MASGDRTEATNTASTNSPASANTAAEANAPTATESESVSGQGQRAQGPPWAATATLDATGIRCECLMNARYHAAREAFLDTVHRWFMFAIIGLGAAALIDFFPKEVHGIDIAIPIKEAFATVAAILAALDLTFDLSNRARIHALMKRRYFELAGDVIAEKQSLQEAQACLDRYSADEEPAYYALLIASWNSAQEMVYGDDAYAYRIPRLHLFFKNIWRYGGKIYPLQPKPVRQG